MKRYQSLFEDPNAFNGSGIITVGESNDVDFGDMISFNDINNKVNSDNSCKGCCARVDNYKCIYCGGVLNEQL